MFRVVFLLAIMIAQSSAAFGELSKNAPQSAGRAEQSSQCVHINSKASLIHLGSLDSFDKTELGTSAAKHLLTGLETNNMKDVSEALAIYKQIIPNENFGGEYTALQWFCEYLLAPEKSKSAFFSEPCSRDFHDFFAANDYAVLKEYLQRKYHLKKLDDEGTPQAAGRAGFLEDFILFNNPRREVWEKSSKMLAALKLKPGQRVADVGCGPGYFTVRFAAMVGHTGKVYAMDTNPFHTEYLSNLVKKHGIQNVDVSTSKPNDIGLKSQVDLVYLCSLYHIIYTVSSEEQRSSLIESIKSVLSPSGRLVIVDNALVEDKKLPYHGPYIAKELLIAQLEHYGFKLAETFQFIPQRYMLVFKLANDPSVSAGAPAEQSCESCTPPDCIQITSKASLAHIPSNLEPDVTVGGVEAAKLFMSALETKSTETAQQAIDKYNELIPKEKFGDEYTAFLWFMQVIKASPGEKKEMLADPRNQSYYDVLGANDFELLKKYVRSRYFNRKETKDSSADAEKSGKKAQDGNVAKSGNEAGADPTQIVQPEITMEDYAFLRDFVLFNNPNRESWEKTSAIIDALKLKTGQNIADVGCGPGYYTFKFADMVGKGGQIYAVDTNQRHLTYIDDFSKKYGIPNIKTVHSRLNDTRLPADSVDVVYMCSLYDMVYTTSIEFVKDQFIESIKKALRKDGRVIIVDNDMVNPPLLHYHGPYIDKDLIIAQMRYYGFDLVNKYQFIPQRYVLEFKLHQNP